MARKMLGRLLNQSVLWLYKKFEADRVHGIVLVDFGNGPHFQTTMRASLQLIYDYDPIRFRRVQRHIGQIVNCYLLHGRIGEYDAADRVCTIDFQQPDPVKDDEPWHQIFYSAFYATTLVHEAAHGELHSRGIKYSPENRARVEKLCFLEENRFARRVARQACERSESILATIMENMESEFHAPAYEAAWKATKLQELRDVWIRFRKEIKESNESKDT